MEPNERPPAPPEPPRSRGAADALRSRAVQLGLAAALGAAFFAGYLTHALLQPPPPEAVASSPRPAAEAAETPPAPPSTARPSPRDFVDDDPAFGPEDAPITIVEFSDFECPFCKRFHDETFRAVLAAYEGKIRFVYRDLPLTSIHPRAQIAAEAGECADEQGRFWLMHDQLFAEQDVWRRAADPVEHFVRYAREMGLDEAQFKDCLRTGRTTAEVQADLQTGLGYGIQGTPSFIINGKLLRGAVPFEIFKQVLDRELAEASEGGR